MNSKINLRDRNQDYGEETLLTHAGRRGNLPLSNVGGSKARDASPAIDRSETPKREVQASARA